MEENMSWEELAKTTTARQILAKLAKHEDMKVRMAAIRNQRTSVRVLLDVYVNDPERIVRDEAKEELLKLDRFRKGMM